MNSTRRSGLARAFAAVVILGSSASIVSADSPIPNPSTVPAHITLVGHRSGTPDAGGVFSVIVRGFDNLPVPGSRVMVDFTSVPDVRLSGDVASPGATVVCLTGTVEGWTDATGTVSFTIVGAAAPGAAQCFETGSPCDGRARVYADGVWIGAPRVSAFDLDGASGVGGGDLSLWLADFGASTNPLRSDHDGDGLVGGADLSLWLARFGSGDSDQSGALYCN